MVLGSGVDSIPSDLAVRLALETLRPAEGAATGGAASAGGGRRGR